MGCDRHRGLSTAVRLLEPTRLDCDSDQESDLQYWVQCNIGFNANATHTSKATRDANLDVYPIEQS